MADTDLKRIILDPSKIQGYERDGLQIPTQPIPEYSRLYAQGLADNQTAVFVPEHDFIPDTLTVKYPDVGNSAPAPNGSTITVSIRRNNQVIWTSNYQGSDALDGITFPNIPIQKENIEIYVATNKAIDFLWLSIRQCHIISVVPVFKVI